MMTHEFDSTSADDLRWLDRLVDGELDDVQRRQLLTELENQPDGWRRCALAFLEAQAWKRSLGAMVAAPDKDARPQLVRTSTWWTSPLASVLAAAASFLIAFALGLAWRGQAEHGQQIATNPPAARAPQPLRPSQPDIGLATDKPQWSTMMVNVDRDGDGVAESIELPVVRGAGFDEEWVRNQPAAIPQHVLRLFERMGHEVSHQRQYYPFDLSDGGRLLVPVDEVDVQFAGRQFQ